MSSDVKILSLLMHSKYEYNSAIAITLKRTISNNYYYPFFNTCIYFLKN